MSFSCFFIYYVSVYTHLQEKLIDRLSRLKVINVTDFCDPYPFTGDFVSIHKVFAGYPHKVHKPVQPFK